MEPYSTLIQHLNSPWGAVETSAENADLGTPARVESGFPILPMTRW